MTFVRRAANYADHSLCFVHEALNIMQKNVHIDGKFCGSCQLCARYVGKIFDIPEKYELIGSQPNDVKGGNVCAYEYKRFPLCALTMQTKAQMKRKSIDLACEGALKITISFKVFKQSRTPTSIESVEENLFVAFLFPFRLHMIDLRLLKS